MGTLMFVLEVLFASLIIFMLIIHMMVVFYRKYEIMDE